MVRSNLQYRSSALKPHTKKLKDKLENVQKRAARYVTHNFYNTKSVYNMLHHLNWPALFHRRNICRLSMLYKITHILLLKTKTCIQFHRQQPSNLVLHFQTFSTRTDYYKYQYSFFPHTETLWNSFPHSVVSAASMLTDSAGEYRLMYQICPK